MTTRHQSTTNDTGPDLPANSAFLKATKIVARQKTNTTGANPKTFGVGVVAFKASAVLASRNVRK